MLQYKIYLKLPADIDWTYLGMTEATSWDISSYDFAFFSSYQWRIDVYDTETELTTEGDPWEFLTKRSIFGLERRYDYDDDMVWDTFTESWVPISSITVTGGGRYKNQIVAMGHKCIYFGEV